jgi:fimbrial chaperone protein
MRRSRRQLAALLGLVLGVAGSQAELAWASNFSVTPIRVVFSPDTRSTLLRLTNQSPEALRFQISGFAWDQSPEGEMQLAPTEDIVFFPTLLTLTPGESRHIRIGPVTPFGASEKTYRIFIEELPPPTIPEGGPAGVQVLTRMSLPIFLQPAKVVQQGHIQGLVVRHGKLSFQVKNTGNIHFIEQTVRVKGFGHAGDTLFEQQQFGWYVPAGGWRLHEWELKDACATLHTLAVEVQTEGKTFHERFDVPPGACSP